MFKRSFSGLLAGVCVLANAAVLPAGTASAEDQTYSMKVSVKVDGDKKEISPYIYGVNAWDTGNIKNVTVQNIRQGGNRYTGYNWETNWSNAGEDWHHSSDTNIGDIGEGAGSAVRKLSAMGEKYNIPFKLATLQMAGYVSADKDGSVSEDEVAPSPRWNKVEFRKDGELSLEPDLEDGVVYMDEYVNYIVNTLGDSTTKTGIQAYSLDNEPVLWNDTHPLIHPEEVSNSELVSKSIELAKVVKEIDSNAEIFGPAFWGILPCANGSSGENYQDPDWQREQSNYSSYLGYYLAQMAEAEKEYGQRLLDVIDIHYYAQDRENDDSVLQAARSLYDETYVENSWLQPYWGSYFPVLPWLKSTVDEYYPGTKIAISEYNVSNGMETVPAIAGIAEAEVLGSFAMNDVYFATYWGTLSENPFVESAINLYTNYDGEGSSFGDTLVEASTEDVSKSAAFASINGSDDSQVTLVLSNKNKTETEVAEITISGSSSDYKSAVVYAIEQDHSDIRIIDVQNDLSGNKLTVELPPLSAAQIVLSDKETDKTVYEAPEEPDIVEETFIFSELEKNKNGFYDIPISDPEALKKAVISYSSSCSTDAGWYGGGGALCFNKMILDDGSAKWGYKSFSFGSGDGVAEVIFDGTFTISLGDDKSDELEAKIGDDSIEFQEWWKSSTNSESGDDVTVVYNSITLVYEYESTGGDDEPDWGDADCDGVVKMNDVVLILQSISSPDRFGENGTDEHHITAKGIVNADVSKDGEGITPMDALVIQKYLLKQIPSLPEV